MFRLRRPDESEVREILEGLAGAAFTYDEVGATAQTPPAGYAIDRYSADLGRGEAVFARAREAVFGFAMYPAAWTSIVTLADGDGPAPDRVFASVIRHLGFYSINPGRVVYVIDEDDRAGFAFGTLPGHSERGEERFVVRRDRAIDVGGDVGGVVRFEALAFSRPAAPLARLGAPIARALQRRFSRDARAAMRARVADSSATAS